MQANIISIYPMDVEKKVFWIKRNHNQTISPDCWDHGASLNIKTNKNFQKVFQKQTCLIQLVLATMLKISRY